MRRAILFASAISLLAVSSDAGAVTSEEVIVRAKAYAFHPWTATSSNLTASCASGYQSVYTPGDYMGLSYDWGGFMSLFQFDQQIAAGYGAGSYPEDGILDCTSGVDCSGFVSRCWKAGHYTTSSVHQTSSTVNANGMGAGDIFNNAGSHMAMFSHLLASGEPVMYQSAGYNVHLHMPGWSWTQGYTPRRYDAISGMTPGNPLGTTTNPYVVSSFPYAHQANTAQSPSDVLDGCGVAPSTKETGPEYIYQVNVTQPGTLHVSLQDDAGVDIDVHLYTSMNTNDCVARHDNALNEPVDCGTYYVVADTYKGASESPGNYSLTIDLTPSNSACGSGPPSYNFNGEMGDACGYPGNENLPFCNPNLGATTCIYTSTSSFCSKPCASDSDCSAIPGGCCADIGTAELYCLTPEVCSNGGDDVGSDDSTDAVGDPDPQDLSDDPIDDGDADISQGDGWTATFGEDDADPVASGCAINNDRRQDRGSPALWLLALALVFGRRREER
jgi:hypothetical protein